jgi:hypothetical protein
MPLLFTQHWDMIRGKEAAYEEFIAKTFIPGCENLGLKAVGGYYVQVGQGPRIISVKSAETLEEFCAILGSPEFKTLADGLKELVKNYHRTLLSPMGRVKSKEYQIQKGVWKFNQYYDLLPGTREGYADFVINEYIPTLGKLDYLEVTGGWHVLMGGISEIISEFTFKHPVDIGQLLDSEQFRELTYKLRRDFATSYKSRILRTTEHFDEPRWFRL